MTAPIVCVGDLMTDVVAIASGPVAYGSDTRAQVRITGGGSAANTAAWLGAVGRPVAFVGRVGADLLGRAAVRELCDGGVDARVAVDVDRPTGAVVVVVVDSEGERSMLPDAGANAALAPDDLPGELFVAGAHLHLSGYPLLNDGARPAALAALHLARAARMTVSVDPSSVHLLAQVGVDRFLDWVEGADLLLANDDEARLLSGLDDAVAAGRALAARFGGVVLKLGPSGAAWFDPGREAAAPALPVEVVDTTGAGDCFAAGFLPAWLAGDDPADALAAGCALAARVVVRPGARPPLGDAGA